VRRFLYHFHHVFNAETYIGYLERILRCYYPQKVYLIQDNASYHKDRDVWVWFSDHRKDLEVYNLPAYSPELNALERIWHHTRLHGTHNLYFANQDELRSALTSTFRSIQKNPSQVMGYLSPYQQGINIFCRFIYTWIYSNGLNSIEAVLNQTWTYNAPKHAEI